MNKRPFEEAVRTGIAVEGTDDEYLVLVTADTPGFDDIYELLFKGELVYPGDEYFNLRFGHGNIHSFDEPGTQHKQVVALMTPTHIRVATSFMVSAIPEHNSKLDVSNAPCEVLPVRQAEPVVIADTEAVNLISPYSITSFNMKQLLGLQSPDPRPDLLETAAWRIRDLARKRIANRLVEASISPNPTEKRLLEENPLWRDLPVERLGIQRTFANVAAWRDKDKKKYDFGFNYHVPEGGAFIGRFSQTNTSYVYGTEHSGREHRRDMKDGLVPVASHIYWKLTEEEQALCKLYPTTVRIFRPMQHTARVFGHPGFTRRGDTDEPLVTLQ